MRAVGVRDVRAGSSNYVMIVVTAGIFIVTGTHAHASLGHDFCRHARSCSKKKKPLQRIRN